MLACARIMAAIASVMVTSAAQAWTEREVSLPARPASLHGTLTLPAGSESVMAVLIIAGSGPVDRNGNLPNIANDSLKLLAHGLADRGIASLRIDKRGIAASRAAGPREEDIRFDTYVADAVAWLDMLRAVPRVRGVGLVGHSEGALVATRAARQTKVDKLVLLAGAGFPAGTLILRQFSAGGVPKDLLAQTERIIAALLRGERVSQIPPELGGMFRASVQPYLISWFKLDPAEELKRAPVPALIVQGTSDLQILIEDADRLHAARPDAAFEVIPSMNHVLRIVPLDPQQNLATYNNPALPLAPTLVPALAGFLLQK
jgi:pimeloyl-ACP methyl ester carboxylesterase